MITAIFSDGPARGYVEYIETAADGAAPELLAVVVHENGGPTRAELDAAEALTYRCTTFEGVSLGVGAWSYTQVCDRAGE